MADELALPNVQRGDIVPYIFNWDDGVNPVDMQGKTMIMTFKFSNLETDAEAVLTKTTVYAAVDAQAALGITAFTLTSAETALLTAGVTMQYGIRAYDTGAQDTSELTYIYGAIIIEDS
jgi:hypothetical protein